MKTLKKILAAFMAIMLAFSLAACQEEEEEVAPAGTTAVGTGSLSVGVLYTSEVEEPSEDEEKEEETTEDAPLDVNFAHRNGIATMQGYLGVGSVVDVNGLDPKDADAFNKAIKDLKSCHVIIATSYDYLALVEEVAAEEDYKGIVFAVYADSTKAAATKLKNTNNNVMLYGEDMYEASYLAGIEAGLKSKESKNNKIGYVAPADDKNTQVTSAVNAFALGAQSVNDKATVSVSVVKDWTNEEAVNKAVKALEKAKCGVVSKYVETAEDASCATVWHLENVYIPFLNTIARGEWTPENYFGGITEGAVDVKLGEGAAEDAKDAIKEAKENIMSGELKLDVDNAKYAEGVSLLK